MSNRQDKESEIDYWAHHGSEAYADEIWYEKSAKFLEQASWQGLVLDAGCGNGGFTARLARPDNTVVGVDISHEMVKVAKGNGGVFVTGDLERLPFRDETFDVAFCSMVLHHFPSIDKVIAEITRVVKDDGTVVIIEPLSTAFARLNRNLGRLVRQLHIKDWKTPNETLHTTGSYLKSLGCNGILDFKMTLVASTTWAEEVATFRQNSGAWSFVMLLRAAIMKSFLAVPGLKNQAYDNIIITGAKKLSARTAS
ncbi:class I SAM-dependent methyltransferase [Chloroflexota bacterium]